MRFTKALCCSSFHRTLNYAAVETMLMTTPTTRKAEREKLRVLLVISEKKFYLILIDE